MPNILAQCDVSGKPLLQYCTTTRGFLSPFFRIIPIEYITRGRGYPYAPHAQASRPATHPPHDFHIHIYSVSHTTFASQISRLVPRASPRTPVVSTQTKQNATQAPPHTHSSRNSRRRIQTPRSAKAAAAAATCRDNRGKGYEGRALPLPDTRRVALRSVALFVCASPSKAQRSKCVAPMCSSRFMFWPFCMWLV